MSFGDSVWCSVVRPQLALTYQRSGNVFSRRNCRNRCRNCTAVRGYSRSRTEPCLLEAVQSTLLQGISMQQGADRGGCSWKMISSASQQPDNFQYLRIASVAFPPRRMRRRRAASRQWSSRRRAQLLVPSYIKNRPQIDFPSINSDMAGHAEINSRSCNTKIV